MTFFRQNIAPFLVVLVFLIALAAASARIFLPTDMAAPAPIEEMDSQGKQAQIPITNLSSAAFLSVVSRQ